VCLCDVKPVRFSQQTVRVFRCYKESVSEKLVSDELPMASLI